MGFSTNQPRIFHFLQGIWQIGHAFSSVIFQPRLPEVGNLDGEPWWICRHGICRHPNFWCSQKQPPGRSGHSANAPAADSAAGTTPSAWGVAKNGTGVAAIVPVMKDQDLVLKPTYGKMGIPHFRTPPYGL